MTHGELGTVVTRRLHSLRKAAPGLDSVVGALCAEGEVAVVGGAPRDWLFGRKPRDLDIVADITDALLERILRPRCPGRTRYGGYKLTLDGVAVDIWSVKSTWAFSVRRSLCATIENLPQTAFYNIDAIAVSAKDGSVFECGFTDAMRNAELSTVFEDNPFPALCAVRGLVLARRYNLRLGKAVLRYFDALIDSNTRWNDLDAAQMSHYGRREVQEEDVRGLLPKTACAALLSAPA